MNQNLIERARKGEVAVWNKDCTLDELREVLRLVWHESRVFSGTMRYYFAKQESHKTPWFCSDFIPSCVPATPVRDFLTETRPQPTPYTEQITIADIDAYAAATGQSDIWSAILREVKDWRVGE